MDWTPAQQQSWDEAKAILVDRRDPANCAIRLWAIGWRCYRPNLNRMVHPESGQEMQAHFTDATTVYPCLADLGD